MELKLFRVKKVTECPLLSIDNRPRQYSENGEIFANGNGTPTPVGHYEITNYYGADQEEFLSPEDLEYLYKPFDLDSVGFDHEDDVGRFKIYYPEQTVNMFEDGVYVKRKRYYGVIVTEQTLAITKQSSNEFPIGSLAYVEDKHCIQPKLVDITAKELQDYKIYASPIGGSSTTLFIEQ